MGVDAAKLATRPEIKNPADESTPSGASCVSSCEYGQSSPNRQPPIAKNWQIILPLFVVVADDELGEDFPDHSFALMFKPVVENAVIVMSGN